MAWTRAEGEGVEPSRLIARPSSNRVPSPIGLPFRWNSVRVRRQPLPAVFAVSAPTTFREAPAGGIEPPIVALTGRRLTVRLHRSRSSRRDGRIRTGDLLLPKPKGSGKHVRHKHRIIKESLRRTPASSSSRNCQDFPHVQRNSIPIKRQGPMLSTPGLETPRGVQDRPGVNSVEDRVNAPNIRRIALSPNSVVSTRRASLPRSQALCLGRRVTHLRDAGLGRDVRANRRIVEMLEFKSKICTRAEDRVGGLPRIEEGRIPTRGPSHDLDRSEQADDQIQRAWDEKHRDPGHHTLDMIRSFQDHVREWPRQGGETGEA